jgi:hypothetical protein
VALGLVPALIAKKLIDHLSSANRASSHVLGVVAFALVCDRCWVDRVASPYLGNARSALICHQHARSHALISTGD